MDNTVSLKGKIAMITGATKGIGSSIALRFANAGAKLVLVNRSDMDIDLLSKLKSETEVVIKKVDLSNSESIHKMWDELEEENVPDILVNNAGIYPMQDFLSITAEQYKKVISINQDAVFWMCQRFLRANESRGGNIVNISSIEAILPSTPNLVHYGASKAAVIAMTRSIAAEYSGKNFRANVITPGGIKTEGAAQKKWEILRNLDLEVIGSGLLFQKRIPMGRLGEGDEVATAALFLASDWASYINGEVLNVDGGFTSK